MPSHGWQARYGTGFRRLTGCVRKAAFCRLPTGGAGTRTRVCVHRLARSVVACPAHRLPARRGPPRRNRFAAVTAAGRTCLRACGQGTYIKRKRRPPAPHRSGRGGRRNRHVNDDTALRHGRPVGVPPGQHAYCGDWRPNRRRGCPGSRASEATKAAVPVRNDIFRDPGAGWNSVARATVMKNFSPADGESFSVPAMRSFLCRRC